MPAPRPRALVLALVPAILLALAGAACGPRVDDTTGTGRAAPAPTTVALPTSSTLPLRDVTRSVPSGPTTGPTSGPTTQPPSAPTTDATSPTPPVTTAAPPSAATPTTAPFDKAGFCAASRVYAIEDVIGLGVRVVGDPAGLLRAYETMVADAPADLAQPVGALGPITRQAVALVEKGEITTPEKLQAWLADSAPRAELEQWVLAQQTIAPRIPAICS